MENGYSVDDLMGFLDWAADKGQMKANTVNAQKAACNQVLGVLESNEVKDLRKVDVESTFKRYTNLNPTKLNPESLRTYRSRFEKALGNFLSYRENPEKWKPGIQERSSNRRKNKGPQETTNRFANNDTKTLSFPFPIREDLTVQISNVPRDLKKGEAKRLGAFLEAIAMDTAVTTTENPN